MVRTKKIIKDAFLYALNKMGYDIINSYVDKIGEDRKILKEEKESLSDAINVYLLEVCWDGWKKMARMICPRFTKSYVKCFPVPVF